MRIGNVNAVVNKIILSVILVLVLEGLTVGEEPITKQKVLEAIRTRNASVEELIRIFPQVGDNNIKCAILFTLGELRAEKAIPLLIQEIDFRPEDNMSRLPEYPLPSVIALGKIGIPAIKPILKEIKSNSNEIKAACCYYALASMGDSSLTIFLLEKEIGNTASEEEVHRLKYVLSLAQEQYSQEQKAMKEE